MNRALEEETEKLARSWMQHEAAWLRDYLVAGVEDPRVNLQSILSRHFLIRALTGERFVPLMAEEYRFGAAMNWLLGLATAPGGADEAEALLFGLRKGVDDVEGVQIPSWLLQIFVSLQNNREPLVPNYVENLLSVLSKSRGDERMLEQVLETFCAAWSQRLAQEPVPEKGLMPTVIEPACGSANDYRFLRRYGLGRLVDYTGLDLCARNIENARALFPDVRFETGNVFEIVKPDKHFDYCIVHDLFEHLSPEGLAVAVKEVCRVTRCGICAGFFQMDEIPEHVVRPMDEYHWNLLSTRRMKEAFATYGFSGQALHIGTFLLQSTGCDYTHNPDAYTFVLRARET